MKTFQSVALLISLAVTQGCSWFGGGLTKEDLNEALKPTADKVAVNETAIEGLRAVATNYKELLIDHGTQLTGIREDVDALKTHVYGSPADFTTDPLVDPTTRRRVDTPVTHTPHSDPPAGGGISSGSSSRRTPPADVDWDAVLTAMEADPDSLWAKKMAQIALNTEGISEVRTKILALGEKHEADNRDVFARLGQIADGVKSNGVKMEGFEGRLTAFDERLNDIEGKLGTPSDPTTATPSVRRTAPRTSTPSGVSSTSTPRRRATTARPRTTDTGSCRPRTIIYGRG